MLNTRATFRANLDVKLIIQWCKSVSRRKYHLKQFSNLTFKKKTQQHICNLMEEPRGVFCITHKYVAMSSSYWMKFQNRVRLESPTSLTSPQSLWLPPLKGNKEQRRWLEQSSALRNFRNEKAGLNMLVFTAFEKECLCQRQKYYVSLWAGPKPTKHFLPGSEMRHRQTLATQTPGSRPGFLGEMLELRRLERQDTDNFLGGFTMSAPCP